MSSPPDARAPSGRVRLARGLLVFAVLLTLVANLLPHLLPPGPGNGGLWGDAGARETVLDHTLRFVTLRAGDDSWTPMRKAFDFARANPGERIYGELFFRRNVLFIYPPSALLVFFARGLVPERIGFPAALTIVSWMLLIVTVWAGVRIFALRLNALSVSGAERRLALATVAFLALTYYPLVKAFSLGQIQVWVNALFAVTFLAWIERRVRPAGLLAGVMCLIKPQYGVLLVWGLLRRRWTFALTFSVVAAAGSLLALAIFGLPNHLDYLDLLSFISERGHAFYSNASVNGLLNRAFMNGNNAVWGDGSFPPYNRVVHVGTVATSVLLIGWALFYPVPPARRGEAVDLAFVSVAATLASPLAWEHHYGILFPVYAYLLPEGAAHRPLGRATIPLLGASFLLTAVYFDAARLLADSRWNVLQSYQLAGGVLLLLYLHVLRSRSVRRPAGSVALAAEPAAGPA